MQETLKPRTIFGRDNLEVLRGLNDRSVDLIYLDPPFNKKKVFTAPIGSSSEGASFDDIFRKAHVKEEWLGLIADKNPTLYAYIQGITEIGHKSNKYYLCYMAVRLMELQRVLKSTGSLYLHCDTTMSHYLKLLLDCIFGEDNFRNEIIWHYKGTGNQKTKFPAKHDAILYYSASSKAHHNIIYVKAKKESGWTGKDQKKCDSVWTDIGTVFQSQERAQATGYPTQKPLELLKRIITASSNEGDLVLDPFCGCATTCVAAELLNRRWIGMDVSKKAFDLVKIRLNHEVQWKNLPMYKDQNYPTFPEKDLIYREDIPERTDGAREVDLPSDKHLLFGRQEGKCNGCNYMFHIQNFTLDHIVPVSKGGGQTHNVQLLCAHCNSVKGDRDMAFLKSRLRELRLIA